MDKIDLPNEIITRTKPGATLTRLPDNHGGSPACDAKHVFGGCLSGCDNFYQSRGIPLWSNRSYNYDICIKCAKANRAIEMILNKEFELLRSIVQPTQGGDRFDILDYDPEMTTFKKLIIGNGAVLATDEYDEIWVLAGQQ